MRRNPLATAPGVVLSTQIHRTWHRVLQPEYRTWRRVLFGKCHSDSWPNAVFAADSSIGQLSKLGTPKNMVTKTIENKERLRRLPMRQFEDRQATRMSITALPASSYASPCPHARPRSGSASIAASSSEPAPPGGRTHFGSRTMNINSCQGTSLARLAPARPRCPTRRRFVPHRSCRLPPGPRGLLRRRSRVPHYPQPRRVQPRSGTRPHGRLAVDGHHALVSRAFAAPLKRFSHAWALQPPGDATRPSQAKYWPHTSHLDASHV